MDWLNSWLGALPHILHWLYCLGFAALAGYLLWRNRVAVRAALHDFYESLRKLWDYLFGAGAAASPVEAAAAEAEAPRLPRFADYADPFQSGRHAGMTPHDLIVYSFQALEAWAREQGCPRGTEETPHELAERLAERHPVVGGEAFHLANQYCRLAFSPDPAPRADREQLARLWRALREVQPPAEPVAVSSNSR